MALSFWSFAELSSAITVVVSGFLVEQYVRGYLRLKSRFLAGLAVLSCLLGLQGGVSLVFYIRLSRVYGEGLGLPLLGLQLILLSGIAVFLWLATR